MRLNHQRLLEKLKKPEIEGKLLRAIGDWLSKLNRPKTRSV